MNSSGSGVEVPSLQLNVKGLSRRAATALVYVLCIQSTFGADAPPIKGELFLDDGMARVWDCRTHQEIKVWPLASTQYLNLTRQYKQASEGGKFKVLVAMKGTVTPSKSSAGRDELLVMNPIFVSVVRGTCGDAQSGE